MNVQDMTKHRVESDIYIGKLLNGRYLIKNWLGRGGMGIVYLAEDINKKGMLVAIKILTFNLVNQHVAERFGREIFIGAQLGKKSKNIVRILSYGLTKEQVPFYVMEYLQGENLKQILKYQPLKIARFLDICKQICLGLDCAHQGVNLKGEIYPIVHRDIKPENIFIHQDTQQGEMVKILDFGIAKFLTERNGMKLTESFIGTLPYCSPEHMEGENYLDVRSDIYSLGLLMFEMLTGKHPFPTISNSFGTWYQIHRYQHPPNLGEVHPQIEIPQELEKLVIRCLAKEMKHRPQNVREILRILAKIENQTHGKYLGDADHIVNQPGNEPTFQLLPVTSATEKECLHKAWPKSKPNALVGFPHLLHTRKKVIPTFWAMLPQHEINKFVKDIHISEFISKVHLYPMILWINLLYDRESSLIRWLSYYLDLRNSPELDMVRCLAETGYYHLLLFPLEASSKCTHVITLNLSAKQRQNLLDAINLSQVISETITSGEAKIMLKNEYEKIKTVIVKKLESAQNNDTISLKYFIRKLFEKLI